MNAPFQGFTPELLAQIAQGAFRPPQAMGGAGLPGGGMQAPQMGGDGGLGAGMAGLGMGLANWKPGGGTFGHQSGTPLAETAAGTTAAETASPFAMAGSNIGTGPVGASMGGGDFWSWLPWR